MKTLKLLIPAMGALVLLAGCNGWGGSSAMTANPGPRHSSYTYEQPNCNVSMKSMRSGTNKVVHGVTLSKGKHICRRYRDRNPHGGYCRVRCGE